MPEPPLLIFPIEDDIDSIPREAEDVLAAQREVLPYQLPLVRHRTPKYPYVVCLLYEVPSAYSHLSSTLGICLSRTPTLPGKIQEKKRRGAAGEGVKIEKLTQGITIGPSTRHHSPKW
jgi:hypothetical protein